MAGQVLFQTIMNVPVWTGIGIFGFDLYDRCSDCYVLWIFILAFFIFSFFNIICIAGIEAQFTSGIRIVVLCCGLINSGGLSL